MEYTLNTGSLSPNKACRLRLIRPILGLPNKIHATVNRMPGITSGISDSAKNSDLNGVFVRSFIQASVVPTKKAKSAVPEANFTEFQNSLAVSELV